MSTIWLLVITQTSWNESHASLSVKVSSVKWVQPYSVLFHFGKIGDPWKNIGVDQEGECSDEQQTLPQSFLFCISNCWLQIWSWKLSNMKLCGTLIALQLSSTQNKSHVKWKTKWDQLSRTSFSKYHNSQQNQVNCVQILLFQHWIWHCLLWKCYLWSTDWHLVFSWGGCEPPT